MRTIFQLKEYWLGETPENWKLKGPALILPPLLTYCEKTDKLLSLSGPVFSCVRMGNTCLCFFSGILRSKKEATSVSKSQDHENLRTSYYSAHRYLWH